MILCITREPKFGVRGSDNLDLLLVPRFAPFTLFSRWE